jgi:hypothetical protein
LTLSSHSYIRDTTLQLSGKVEDLEDVMAVMAVLEEVRGKEANIDALIGPIEEMYALLLRYEVGPCGWIGPGGAKAQGMRGMSASKGAVRVPATNLGQLRCASVWIQHVLNAIHLLGGPPPGPRAQRGDCYGVGPSIRLEEVAQTDH